MSKSVANIESKEIAEVKITEADIKKYICPLATEKEIKMFMELCKHQNLNPFIGDVYLIKYKQGEKAQQVVGRHLFNKRADSHPDYDGMEQYFIFTDDISPEITRRAGINEGQYNPTNCKLVGAITEVYRKDKSHPLSAVAYMKDFDKGQATWKALPTEMILKVSEVLALRKAFPQEFQGMYIAEEMGIENLPAVSEKTEKTKKETAKIKKAKEELEETDTDFDKEIDKLADEIVEIEAVEKEEQKPNLYEITLSTFRAHPKYQTNPEIMFDTAKDLIKDLDPEVVIESEKDVIEFCTAYYDSNGKYPFKFMNEIYKANKNAEVGK